MKAIARKTLSLLMTVTLLINLVPGITIPAGAEEASPEIPAAALDATGTTWDISTAAQLDDALVASASGDTIRLTADVDHSLAGITVDGKSILFDLNGHNLTIVNPSTAWNSYGINANNGANISMTGDGSFNVSGISVHSSTVTVSNITASDYGVMASEGSTVTVKGNVTARGTGVAGLLGGGTIPTSIIVEGNVTSTGTISSNAGVYVDGAGTSVTVKGFVQSGSTGVQARNGGSAIVDGKITGAKCGAYAQLGGTITAMGGVAVTGTSSTSSTTICGVKAESPNSSISITGDITSTYEGVEAQNASAIDVTGNVLAQNLGVYNSGATVTVRGSVTSVGSNGIETWRNGETTVFGNVTGESSSGGYGVKASYGGRVIVGGTVESKGGVGVSAVGAASSISVSGNVIGPSNGAYAFEDASISIGGNVIAVGVEGLGAKAANNSNITIDGTITAAAQYLEVGGLTRNQDQYLGETSKQNYFTYMGNTGTDTSVIWVKVPTTSAPVKILNAYFSNATQKYSSYADIGDTYAIMLLGESGGTVSAAVSYRDNTHNTDATQTVALTESQIGGTGNSLYTGSFTVTEGMAAINGVEFTLNKDGLTPAEYSLPASMLPEIRGTLIINMTNPNPGADVKGVLCAYSVSAQMGNSKSILNENSVQLRGLKPAPDYSLNMTGPMNFSMGRLDSIAISAGQTTQVNFTPTLTSWLKVRLMDGTANLPLQYEAITVRDAATRQVITTLVSGEEGYTTVTGGFRSGQEIELVYRSKGFPVTIGGILQSRYYQPETIQPVVLAYGENTPVMVINEPAKDAAVQGTVAASNGVPLKYAVLSIHQVFGDSNISYVTVTADASGHYSLPIYSGFPTTVSFSKAPGYTSYGGASQTFTAVPGETKAVNFSVAGGMIVNGEINLYTKYIGDADYSRNTLDAGTIWAFNFRTKNLTANALSSCINFDGSFIILGSPGDTIQVTADGLRASLPSVSTQVTVDENYNASCDIYLAQTGAIIRSRLLGLYSDTYGSVYATAVDAETNLPVKCFLTKKAASNYELWVEKPGTYRIRYSTNNWPFEPLSAVRAITVAEGETVSLGDVTLLAGVSSDSVGGGYYSTPSGSVPGGTITLRADYERCDTGISSSTDPGTLTLEIPAGTSFVPGSLTKNGVSLPDPDVNAGSFDVSITGSDSVKGCVVYRAKLEDTISANRLFATASYKHMVRKLGTTNIEYIIENVFLGTANILVQQLSLSVPEYSLTRNVTIKGFAPAGSTVTLYDRDVPIGSALSSASGNWYITVQLPGEDGVKYLHELRATAEINGKTETTDVKTLTHDPLRPQLTGLVVYSKDGVPKHLDTRNGVVSFPYVFIPEKPNITVSAQFTNSSTVTDVIISLVSGGCTSRTKATYNPLKDTYDATLVDATAGAAAASFGYIYVDYTPVEGINTFSKTPPTESQLRNQLPSDISDFVIDEDSIVNPDAQSGDVKTGRFEYYDKPGGTKTSVQLTVQPLTETYYPTAEDEDFVQSTEIPIYNLSMDIAAIANNRSRITVKMIVPDTFLGITTNTSSSASVLSSSAFSVYRSSAASPVRLLSGGMELLPHAAKEIVFIVETGAIDAKSATELSEDFKKLFELQDLAAGCESATAAAGYQDRIGQLVKDALAGRAVTAAYSVLSLAVAPETFGLGTIAIWGLGQGIDLALAHRLENRIENLKKEIENDSDCKPKDPDDPDPDNNDSDDDKSPSVKPVWIRDPSGYVYEVTPENRLDGVKATALYRNGNGEWQIWDAAWYDQENPMMTDGDGKYAWDVPNGEWKVMYEKDGYQTVYSEVLPVPPIQTDINIAMVSTAPPAVRGAYYTDQRDGIDITFDKYVLASTVNSGTISIYSQAQENDLPDIADFLQGTFEAVAPVEYNGHDTAKVFRFTPSAALDAAKTYQVSFMPVIQSYAGVLLGTDGSGRNYATAVTAAPPVAVTGIALDMTRLNLQVGDQPVALTAAVSPADAANKAAIWSTSDSAVATVDQSGLITPVGKGTGVITAKTADGGFTAYCNVYVTSNAVLVTGVTLDKSVLNLTVGGAPEQLTASVLPTNAANKAVQWSVCNTKIVTVDQNGLVTPVGVGNCVVTVATLDGGFTARCPVHVTASSTPSSGGVLNETIKTEITAAGKQTLGSMVATAGSDDMKALTAGAKERTAAGNTEPVVIHVITDASTSSVLLTLPGSAFASFAAGSEIPLTIDAGLATLTFPASSINAFSRAAGTGDVTFGIQALDKSALSAQAQAAIGNHPVYSFFVAAGGTTMTDLAGTVKISIPYTPTQAELDGQAIIIYYIKADGTLAVVSDCKYDPVNHAVNFLTHHFSTYAIAYRKIVFKDVSGWYADAVSYLAARGIMNGQGEGIFKPDAQITRAEFAMLLYNLSGETSSATASAFSDVKTTDWFFRAVQWAYSNAIATGYDNKFNPAASITRQDMAVMMLRYAKKVANYQLPKSVTAAAFKDNASIADYAKTAVTALQEAGIVSGSNGYFAPADNAKRSEAAKMITAFLQGMVS